MNTPTNVVHLRQPEELEDPLTDILRSGARRLLAQAVELEAETFLAGMQALKLRDGRDRLVRHGYGPERMIQTGIGPVAVSRVKIRDRGAASDDDRVRFSSSILPKWARRTRSLDALLPILYLRGVSTGDFQEALAALLGRDAPNLSPSVIARLSAEWQAEYERWQGRDLSARRYLYVWADGVYLQARMEEHAECMLVIIGATPEGAKELVGFQVGVRESAQSWRELLIEVKRRGLTIAPEIAVGDGALGFWKALEEIYPGTRHQRCWVHKTTNVLNKVPRAVQATMKADLREIHGAETRSAAEAAIDIFAEKYGAKYARAVECLRKDRDALLTFYDFPAEHWDHLRTSNPIESVFATVRHRIAVVLHGQADGLQTCYGCRENLAKAERRKPVAEGRSRCHVPQRDGGHRSSVKPRRLIAPSPKLLHSSTSTSMPIRRNRARRSGLSAPPLKNSPSSMWLSCPPEGPFGWWMMNASPLAGSRPRNQESPLALRYSSRRSDIGASSMLCAKRYRSAGVSATGRDASRTPNCEGNERPRVDASYCASATTRPESGAQRCGTFHGGPGSISSRSLAPLWPSLQSASSMTSVRPLPL